MMADVIGHRQLARLRRLDPSLLGARLGGFVYGTIVVLSVLVAGLILRFAVVGMPDPLRLSS